MNGIIKNITNQIKANAVGAGPVSAKENSINKFNANNVGVDALIDPQINHAITLISLIITIIILLILAGVTINVLIGDKGLFKTAKKAGEKTAIAELKEKADIEYATLKVQNYEQEVKLSQIIERLKNKGYKIEQINNGTESKITGITVNPETPVLNIEETKYIEITINKEEANGTRYYANIYDAYYEISLEKGEIKIRRET